MDAITKFSLKNAAAVILVALLVTAGGIWSAGQLKKETMPDIDIPVVAVVTVYPGAAPQDVYDDITDPVEKAMRGVAGIDKVTAQSGDSVSMVIAQFSYSQDMDAAEADVNKVLQSVKLPDNAIAPKVSRISFGSAPIMKLAIIGQETDAEALRAEVRDEMIPALQSVEGVGEARLSADAPANIRIEFDTDRLADEGLTADTVIQQLQAANMAFPIGTVDLGGSTEPIRAGGTLDSVADIENFRIAVYPNQSKMMGDAFAQIGEGMGALGKGMGALAQGMGQGFSALGGGVGTVGQMTGEVAVQAGMINGIQRLQSGMYALKYDALPQLRAAASMMDTSSPAYAQMMDQIASTETTVAMMAAGIKDLQANIEESQGRLKSHADSSKSGSSGSGVSMPSGGSSSGLSASSSGGSGMDVEIGSVTLADVATVTYAPEDGAIGSRANGHPAALIDIVKTQDANTVDVSGKVTAELARLKSELPKGTSIETVYDASNGINGSVEGMMREGLLGALFAIVVIMLFLRNWRATVISAVSIPLSIMIAFVFLKQTNVTLNVMTLGGLTVAIGAALVVWTLASSVGFSPPLLVSLVGGGLLLVGLGVGIAMKKRAAWAFALATAGVSVAALLLAVPAIHRAGSGIMFANVALGAVVVQLVLLIVGKDEF